MQPRRLTGEGEPGFEADVVPRHDVRVEGGRVLVSREAVTKRHAAKHEEHRLARPIVRAEGPVRVAGISATLMDRTHPRYSTSEALLEHAIDHARQQLGCRTQIIRLDSLRFRSWEGFYSKSSRACTWPCSIMQMDATDEMELVYEGVFGELGFHSPQFPYIAHSRG